MALHEAEGEIKGLKDFPKELRPPVTPIYLQLPPDGRRGDVHDPGKPGGYISVAQTEFHRHIDFF